MSVKKKNKCLLLGVIVFCLIFSATCRNNKSEIKHVFLVIVDTLRADHLGCYGYIRNTSPFIDSMAAKGVVYEQAVSQSATTAPSHASVFTGLYPYQHRVLANGYMMDDSVTTLPEILKSEGIRTSAFTSTDAHFISSNIAQGYDFYEEPKNVQKLYGRQYYRTAQLTVKNSIIWLDNFDKDEKLFHWVHLFDPHQPFYPPKKYVQKMKKDVGQEDYLKFLEPRQIDLEVFNNDVAEMINYLTQYDAEIAYVDEEIKNLYEFAEKKGLTENSLWIITGDHGEGLGQHRWPGHAAMIFQEQIRVPLIFFTPGGQLKPARVKKCVEIFDIFSTVLDVFGVTLPEDLSSEVRAVSLWENLQNPQSLPAKEYSFSEREKFKPMEHFRGIRFWEDLKGEKMKFSLQNQGVKYIYRSGSVDELYDLNKDPHELKNVLNKESYSSQRNKFKAQSLKKRKEIDSYAKKKLKQADPETIKKLKSLGYI